MPVSVDNQNDVALIRMDDGKANAINFEMIAALNAASRSMPTAAMFTHPPPTSTAPTASAIR